MSKIVTDTSVIINGQLIAQIEYDFEDEYYFTMPAISNH